MTRSSQKQPLRVLISGGLAPGGIKTHTVELCKVLLNRGHLPSIVGSFSAWPIHSVLSLRRIGVKVYYPKKYFAVNNLIQRAISYLACLNFSIQYGHSFDRLICMGTGRSHALYSFFTTPDCIKIYYEIMAKPEKAMSSWFLSMDYLLAISRHSESEIKKLCPQMRTHTLPMLTRGTPSPKPRVRLKTVTNSIQITYLGRYIRYKRADLIVRHWKKLKACFNQIQLSYNLYGNCPEGTYLDEINEIISNEGLASEISVNGEYSLSELDSIFYNTDIVVSPSLSEGLGIVLIEAMQRGVPIVATAAGGTEELGNGNPDAIIVKTNDENEFMRALIEMIKRVSNSDVNKFRLHQWVEDHYGYTTLSKKWIDCIERPDKFYSTR